MPAILIGALSAIGGAFAKALLSLGTKLATEEFAEWALLWGAKRLVESTKTPHDDEWYAKVAESAKTGK